MRHILAVCLLCSIPSSQAGTVTGTQDGVIDITMLPITKGTPGTETFYGAVPAVLAYSADTDTGIFQFSLTDNVYSIDTSASLFVGEHHYFSYLTPPPDSNGFFFMESGVYHVYSIIAEIGFVMSTSVLLSANFNLTMANSSGTGYEVIGGFMPNVDPPGDPPAGVPEPSSVVMMGIGLLTLGLFWGKK